MGASHQKEKEEKKVAKEQAQRQKANQSIWNLEKKMKDLDLKIEANDKRVKALDEEFKAKMKAGNENAAKRVLVSKKKIMAQISQLQNSRSMLEDQKFMLENADNANIVTDALKDGNKAIKEISKENNAEVLGDIKAEMDEYKENQAQFDDVLQKHNDEENLEIEDEFEKAKEQMLRDEAAAFPQANRENLNPAMRANRDQARLEAELGL